MKIKVLFFARVREIFGEHSRWVEAPEGSSIDEVVARLEPPPGQASFKRLPLLFAVNENFETPEKRLSDRDELAIMTPVSGG